MVIKNNAFVYGLNNNIVSVIHIKGGGFIVGEDVVFQDLPGGILLENRAGIGQLSPNVLNKQYDLKDITFNNTPIMHHRTVLNISNCIFNDEFLYFTGMFQHLIAVVYKI